MKLILPLEIEKKINAYAHAASPNEVAGFGKVRVEGDSIFVEDVMIYEQTVTGAHVDMDAADIAKWATGIIKAGGSTKDWKLWWHSHVDMQAFFSAVDTGTIDRSTEFDWMVSLVVNKRRERHARLDLYRPFRVFLDKIDVEVEKDPAAVIPDEIRAEVAAKVKTRAPIMYGKKDATTLSTADIIELENREYDDSIPMTRKQARKYAETVLALHTECPMYKTRGKDAVCLRPYHRSDDCTGYKEVWTKLAIDHKTAARSDANNESEAYEAMQCIRELEDDLAEMTIAGMSSGDQYTATRADLVEWYRHFADLVEKTDGKIARYARLRAENVEKDVAIFSKGKLVIERDYA